jgi:hypothetical protein
MRNAFLIMLLLGLGVESLATPVTKRALLRAVEVKRPNIVIRGAYLGRVEVWAVPTGTGITPDEYALVGNARRKTEAGRNEIWLFPIDCTSPLIPSTEVFVKGFDLKGKNIGTKSLPYNGASEIGDALCSDQ